MVKIDFGCHVDGYIAVVAHTYVVPDEGEPCAMRMHLGIVSHWPTHCIPDCPTEC